MTDSREIDKRHLRNVLGTFTTGVTVVTTRARDGAAYGVTANSFSSVSLDPPLVLWSQSLSSKSFGAFQESNSFAINILADDQIEISKNFAKSCENKFVGIDAIDGLNDVPIINGVAAHLECTKVASYPAGDHVIYLGRVENLGLSHRRPLAFTGGRYMVPYAHELGPVSLQIGGAVMPSPATVRHVVKSMPKIAEEVGNHSLCLAVWSNHGATTISWEPSRNPVSGKFPVGLVLNTTGSALGRCFAAFLPEEITRVFVEEDLRLYRRQGETPEIQRDRFDVELVEVRKRGMALVSAAEAASRVHNIPTTAFAAPIFDKSRTIVFAMSMIAHVDRLSGEWQAAGPRTLATACASLSKELESIE